MKGLNPWENFATFILESEKILVSHDKFSSGAKVSLTDQEKRKTTTQDRISSSFFLLVSALDSGVGMSFSKLNED